MYLHKEHKGRSESNKSLLTNLSKALPPYIIILKSMAVFLLLFLIVAVHCSTCWGWHGICVCPKTDLTALAGLGGWIPAEIERTDICCCIILITICSPVPNWQVGFLSGCKAIEEMCICQNKALYDLGMQAFLEIYHSQTACSQLRFENTDKSTKY